MAKGKKRGRPPGGGKSSSTPEEKMDKALNVATMKVLRNISKCAGKAFDEEQAGNALHGLAAALNALKAFQ